MKNYGDEFEKITNSEDMNEYLESTANSIGDKDDIVYSHYTDISSALSIFSSGTLWLNSYSHMNDIFEKELLDRSTKKGKYFFISLSRTNESLALYNIYGMKESSVVLMIPQEVFVCDIREILDSEHKGGIDDDSRSGSYIRNVEVFCYDGSQISEIETCLSLLNVVYCNPYDNSLSIEGKCNSNIISPLKEDSLAGLVKYDCWEYEKETRFCAEVLGENMPSLAKLSIDLPKDFCNKVKVILGPGFNKEKYYDELIELKRLGVLYENSVYDGFFKDTIRIRRPEKQQLIEEYTSKKYEGNDPWEGKLSIEIKRCFEHKIDIVWENDFETDGVIRSVSERLLLDIDEDLVSRYDIRCKLPISDDDNEYLSYSYSGTIQLVDKKVLISFNSGEVYYYTFGGSGSDTYCGSGSWRMGSNRLVILNQMEG